MKMGESPREMDKKPSVNNNQITQNVKDLLSSREVENIFENSDFVYMLNQAGGDRQILAKQLGISTHQLSYVTHSGEGEGLLFYGSTILPFVDHFPKNTELYRIMTTKPHESISPMLDAALCVPTVEGTVCLIFISISRFFS